MGPRPRVSPEFQNGVQAWLTGDFREAEGQFRVAGSRYPEARRAWWALLFERQGYARLEAELSDYQVAQGGKPLEPELSLLLARAQANQGRWQAALATLTALEPEDLRAQLLRAEAWDHMGDTRAAEAYIKIQSQAMLWPWQSLALHRAAGYFARRQEYAVAESAYKLLEKADPSYFGVHKALADIYRSQGRMEDARVRLKRAQNVDPDNLGLGIELAALSVQHPRLKILAKAELEAAMLRRFQRLTTRVAAVQIMPGEPQLRVGLAQNLTTLQLKTGSESLATWGGQGLSLAAGTVYEIKANKKGWALSQLSPGHSQALTSSSEMLLLSCVDPESTWAVYDLSTGKGYFFARDQDRSLRGSLELKFREGELSLVNQLGLETYLLGVVPAEISPHAPAAALEAQAVAARSDAWARRGRHKSAGFDVCSEVHCAAYGGIGVEDPRSTAAITATAGLVLENEKGRLLQALYMGNCGGHTQPAYEAWPGPQDENLNGIYDGPRGRAWAGRFPPSPADFIEWVDAPGAAAAWCQATRPGSYASWRWTLRYSAAELSDFVNRRHKIGKLLAVEPIERSPQGYVKRLRLIGEKASSDATSDRVRTAARGLRSNAFYVETRRDDKGLPLEFIFHGAGWGHGVGLCQMGAASMAAVGIESRDILKHYYPEARLKQRYGQELKK